MKGKETGLKHGSGREAWHLAPALDTQASRSKLKGASLLVTGDCVSKASGPPAWTSLGRKRYLPREAFRNFTAILWFFLASSTSFWCRSPCSFWRCVDFLRTQHRLSRAPRRPCPEKAPRQAGGTPGEAQRGALMQAGPG